MKNGRRAPATNFLLSVLAGGLGYSISNPFVLIHYFGDREILLSNLRNSQDMYRAPLTREGVMNALDLIGHGASPILAGAGGVIAIASLRRPGVFRSLLLMPALLVAIQFVMLATNKPAEYARFAIFLDIALLLSAFAGIAASFKHSYVRYGAAIALLICTGIFGAGYVWHFGRDAIARTTRLIDAERLEKIRMQGAREIAIYSDPAPY